MGLNFVVCNWLIFELGVGFGISMSIELFFSGLCGCNATLAPTFTTLFFPKTNPLETKISLL